ncbi:MAG: host attachment protein [Thalassobaculum sp.]|uniref:host attachment protein n=1 Tax=Thalassobaculum sp. TaxID=2022740 RepID=UPI0032EAE86E
MAKPVTWIVVADAGRAKVYEAVGGIAARSWKRRHEMTAALPPSRDIDSDRPGRSFDSGGPGRHAMEPPTDPHEHAKERFARDVMQTLDDGRRHEAFQDLVVVAAPAFLGDLRSKMPDRLRDRVRHEVDKDYSKLPEDELRQRIRDSI